MEDHLLSPVADFSPYGRFNDLVAAGAGFDGTVYLAFGLPHPTLHNALSSGFRAWETQKQKREQPKSYRVIGLYAGQLVCDVTIEDETSEVHHVQPLPDGLLLASARCSRRSDTEIERNGRIYDLSGRRVSSFVLGDGIQDLQTTSDGRVWASYFDEGIFGNFGWEQPLGAAGLVEWDLAGRKRYEFEPSGDLDPMSDCYALNVVSDADVWCCYYTEFPLVHLRDGRPVAAWHSPSRGTSAFAISHNRMLMQGGYDESDSYILATLLNGGALTTHRHLRWLDEEARPLKADRTFARGPVMTMLRGNRLYQVHVDSLANAAII